jgi:hypothetical protein
MWGKPHRAELDHHAAAALSRDGFARLRVSTRGESLDSQMYNNIWPIVTMTMMTM